MRARAKSRSRLKGIRVTQARTVEQLGRNLLRSFQKSLSLVYVIPKGTDFYKKPDREQGTH